jgi:hypothetical protein
VFIAVAVVAGVAIGLLRGGRLSNLGEATFRVWPLLVAGVVVQAAAAFAPSGAVAIILVSYAILLAFAAANLSHVGMGVVFVGIAMNLIVIGANGGMPVRAGAIVAAGIVPRGEVHDLDFGTKRHLERPDDTLTFLGDIIPFPGAREVLSFGDLAMSVGVADVLVHLLRRRRPAVTPTAPTASASTGSD